jgi:hypothetical protein
MNSFVFLLIVFVRVLRSFSLCRHLHTLGNHLIVVPSQYVITQIRARVKNRSLFSFCYMIFFVLLFKKPMLIML